MTTGIISILIRNSSSCGNSNYRLVHPFDELGSGTRFRVMVAPTAGVNLRLVLHYKFAFVKADDHLGVPEVALGSSYEVCFLCAFPLNEKHEFP